MGVGDVLTAVAGAIQPALSKITQQLDSQTASSNASKVAAAGKPDSPAPTPSAPIPHYSKGTGYVPKTEIAVVHKGEAVISAKENKVGGHRALFHLHAGGLHDWAGIPHDQPVPESKKREAAASDNPHVQKMGQFALNAEHFKK